MCEEWSRKNFSNSPQKLEKRQFGEKEKKIYYCTNKTLHMGKKQASGAQKRKKKKEKEAALMNSYVLLRNFRKQSLCTESHQ